MCTGMFPRWFEALVIILGNRLSLGRTFWSVLSAGSQDTELQSIWSSAPLRASVVSHQYCVLGDALVALEEVEPQYKLVVQMQILLEYIICKQVSIYSGDMSHFLRYHGYSVSSPNSTKYNQLFTIFCTCTCTTGWLFCSSGHSFLCVLARTGANGHWNAALAKKLPCNRNKTAAAVGF